jgi:hypothetical protein
MRTARGQHVGGVRGQVSGGRQHPGEQPQDPAVGRAQDQNVTGLRDVLRGRSPMHPSAMLASSHAQLGDQSHQRVTGLGDATLNAPHVQVRQAGSRLDHRRRRGRDDPAFRLGRGQSSLHI